MKRLVIFALAGLMICSCNSKLKVEEGDVIQYKVLKTGSDKPQAPIDLDIGFDSTPVVGKSSKIIFSATPLIDAQDFVVKIHIPEDVAFDKGQKEWRGDIVKGCKKELSVNCTIPDNKKREIFVTATITEGKTKLTKVLSMQVGSEENPQKGMRKKNQKGENIIEL